MSIIRVRNGAARKNAGLSGWLERKRLEESLAADTRANKKLPYRGRKRKSKKNAQKQPRYQRNPDWSAYTSKRPSVLTKPGPKPIPTQVEPD